MPFFTQIFVKIATSKLKNQAICQKSLQICHTYLKGNIQKFFLSALPGYDRLLRKTVFYLKVGLSFLPPKNRMFMELSTLTFTFNK